MLNHIHPDVGSHSSRILVVNPGFNSGFNSGFNLGVSGFSFGPPGFSLDLVWASLDNIITALLILFWI